MGLFIGASLLSFVQIMEYFVDETLLCLGCLKRNEQAEPGNNDSQNMHVISNGNADKNAANATTQSNTGQSGDHFDYRI